LAAIISYSGIPERQTLAVANENTLLLNAALASLKPGDVLTFPEKKLFYLNGDVKADGLRNVTIKFASTGTILFQDNISAWPKDPGDPTRIRSAFNLSNLHNVVITSTMGSSGVKALIDGNGGNWWGYTRYLLHAESRPMLMVLPSSRNLTVEHIYLKDSGYWTFWAPKASDLVVRFVKVSARRTNANRHTINDLGALNTDGIDFTGHNIHVHDCDIWNQDDCVAVKDDTQNVLVERVSCSGLGFVVGSISDSLIRNITFRDSTCPNTYKCIYVKTRITPSLTPGNGIFDVLYENITITQHEQFAIFLGPAQQVGQSCNVIWPFPGTRCIMTHNQNWNNIILRNIKIVDPRKYIGAILGSQMNPMKGIVFENVYLQNQSWLNKVLYGKTFLRCENAHGTALGGDSRQLAPCLRNV
jgi:polygalacturonase